MQRIVLKIENIGEFEEKFKYGKEMSEIEIEEIRKLLGKYEEIIEYNETKKANVKRFTHEIRIKEGIEPIKQKQYKETEEKKKIIREEIDKMIEQEVIRESKSPWRSPVTLVQKKGGEWRFCIDFRKLNEVTIEDSYPIPRIDELLHKYREKNWFTSLDLAAGYWQIPMKEEDREKTAFACSRGFYEYNVMPFGLKSAPATFQRMMDKILKEERDEEFVEVYLDDIMISSKNFKEHIEHIERVLDRLRDEGLIIKLKKCKFGERNIEYLGHIVGRDGLKPSKEKLKAIEELKRPENITEVRALHGLCSYYRRFVKNFSEVVRPIVKLTKKDVRFEWGEEQEKAFIEIKEKLIRHPILVQPDFKKEFILITDASGVGVGAILAQLNDQGKEVVVAYASKTLTKAEENYSITELECLAIVWGVEYFRQYLFGRKFKVITDHSALKILKKPNETKGRRARWEMKLLPYDFEIIYRAGKENKNADALSRLVKRNN